MAKRNISQLLSRTNKDVIVDNAEPNIPIPIQYLVVMEMYLPVYI